MASGLEPPAGGPRGREALLTPLLVLTGAATLVHESAWFRMLVPALGAGVLPAATVSAGALLGLSAGAALGGRLADRTRRPLLVLGLAEAAAAALGLAVPAGVAVVAALDAASGSSLLAASVASLLLALVALPMGASLPAAVRAIDPARERVAACFRRVYGWNTVGAVLGVLGAAAWLLEAEGNRASLRWACAAEALVALVVLAVAARRRAPRPQTPTAAAGDVDAPRPIAPRPIAPRPIAPRPNGGLRAAAFLAGAAGLAVQVAWVRRLTPAVGTTYQAFATVLGVHLVALALGSLVLGPRRGLGGRGGAALVLALAAIPVALLPDAVRAAAAWAAESVAQTGPDAWRLLLVRAGAAAWVVLPSTLIGGAALPWLLRAAAPTHATTGRASGGLLAANALGSALAAIAAVAFAVPAVGTAGTLRLAAALYLVAAACVVGRRLALALAVPAVLLAVQPWALPFSDTSGRDAIGATFAPERLQPEDAEALLYAEGPVTTVVVRDRDGRREFWIEGNIEASTHPTDRLHLALLGHLPMAIHHAAGGGPAHVAVVGLGSGMTSRAVAAWGPASLVVHEVEPRVERAAALFAEEGGGLPPGATLRFGDGRRGVARTEGPLDVVTSDPIHPGVAGSAYLYGLEHYRSLAEHLGERGIACQWLPLYQMEPDDLRLVARTFAAAFAASYLFLAGGDAILIGTRSPLRLDEARLREALAGPAGDGLRRLGLAAPGRLLGLLVRDPEGFRAFAGDGPLNTDDRLLLEFRAGRHVQVLRTATNARLLAVGRVDAATLLAAAPSDAFRAELDDARAFQKGMRAWLGSEYEAAAEAFAARAAADPADRFAATLRDDARLEWALDLLEGGADEAAADLARQVLAGGAAEVIQRLDAAEVLLWAGLEEEARAAARSVLALGKAWPRALRILGR